MTSFAGTCSLSSSSIRFVSSAAFRDVSSKSNCSEFESDYGLKEVASEDLILRGARLAQDEERFKRSHTISKDESDALERGKVTGIP